MNRSSTQGDQSRDPGRGFVFSQSYSKIVSSIALEGQFLNHFVVPATAMVVHPQNITHHRRTTKLQVKTPINQPICFA